MKIRKSNRAPRRKLSRQLQALIGEESSDDLQPSEPTAESHYRITTYYQSLADKVLLEMKSRFEGNDQDILCAFADVVFNAVPSDKNLALVSSFYTLDMAILTAEKAIFQNFLAKNTAEMKGATMIVIWAPRGSASVLQGMFNFGHDTSYIVLGGEVFQWLTPYEY